MCKLPDKDTIDYLKLMGKLEAIGGEVSEGTFKAHESMRCVMCKNVATRDRRIHSDSSTKIYYLCESCFNLF